MTMHALCERKNCSTVAGIDEAGRGPLAGPVVAAAVVLHPAQVPAGLADSKVLDARRREALADEIRCTALAWSYAWADRAEIDTLNILNATLLAMRRAILGLRLWPLQVLVDGNRLPDLYFGARHLEGVAVVGGDASIAAISAASIIAKVERDRMMRSIDRLYPQYGFAQHKGYGTRAHRQNLERHGPCPEHRRSFRPLCR